MSDYDFSTLNDKDFEELVVDLLSAEFSNRIERFKSGKDGGVDGRFFTINGKEEVIQCKHWIKSGVNALITSLSNKELAKVHKLNPQKYFLITSLSLSRENKIKIKDIFKDYIKIDNQILGKEDLNDLLKKHSNVERNHYKLWISSTTVLETIFNADIIGTSRYKLEEINSKSIKYVVTESHVEAIDILEEKGSLIISGLPGIGKTTLADQICRSYLAQGFEFYYIEDSISSIEKVYKEEKSQIFYFDDFLGSNYLEAIENKEDSKISSFIRRVEKNKNKRFILTSRTNILNQGKRLSSAFYDQNINRNEYELVIGNLKSIDKAKILYNHIFFSNLAEDFIDELYIDERYKEIINHKNYNPRVISFITDSQRLIEIKKDSYWLYILSTLEDPAQIWGNVFDRQIDDLSKDIMVTVVLHKGRISENELEEIYYKLCAEKNGEYGKTFSFIMRALTGSLLNRNVVGKEIYYDLFNPSISDFITLNYFSNKFYILKLIILSKNISCLETLIDLGKNNIIDKKNISYILKEFLIENKNKKIWSEFSLVTLSGFLEISDIKEIFNLVNDSFFVDKNYSIKSFKFILYLINNGIVISDNDFFGLHSEVKSIFIDSGDYYLLSNLSNIFSIIKVHENSEHYILLKKEILEYFYSEITSMVIQDNIVDGIYKVDDYYEDLVVDYITTILKDDFPIKFDEDDIYDIISYLDVDDAIQANMNGSYNNEYDKENFSDSGFSQSNYMDPITDLFDRS